MKKLSLLVALALLVSFGAFAQVSLDYSVTGSATMTWGVDLDKDPITNGFKNETASSFDLSVTLDPASVSKGGEGVYGMIELTGFGVKIGDTVGVKWDDVVDVYDKDGDKYDTIDAKTAFGGEALVDADGSDDDYDYTLIRTGINVSAPSVAAKIVLSDALFVKIASKPDFDYNNAKEAVDGDGVVKIDQDYAGGFTLGVTTDVVTANVNYVSKKDKDYSSNMGDDYAVGADIKIAPADLIAVTVYGAYNPNFYEQFPVFIGANIDLKPVDMLSVNIGVDAGLPEDGDASLDLDLSIPVTITDAITVTLAGSMMKNAAADPEMDGKLSVAVTGDAAFSLDVKADDVTAVDNGLDLEVIASASYKAMLDDTNYVKPGVNFTYDAAVVDVDTDDKVKLKAYLDAAVIANTVFTIAYETEQMLGGMADSNDVGDIKIITKITY